MTVKMSTELLVAEAATKRSKPSVDELQILPPKEHAGLQYTLLADDMIIRNGRFAGRSVSELVRSIDGRDYVGQIWRIASPEIKSIIRRFFSE